jgi:diguanylate cyclase (GGDEF)-like protein
VTKACFAGIHELPAWWSARIMRRFREATVHSDTPGGLSDSPFAREIGVGDIKLRFGQELEAQYRHQHLRRMQLRVRVWFTFMAIVATVFALSAVLSLTLHFEGFHIRGVTDWIHIASDATCIPILLWLVWSRSYEQLYLMVASVAVPIYVGTASIVITQVILGGERQALAWMALFIMATYFFSGLLFRAAVFSNVVAVVVFVAVSAEQSSMVVLLRALLILATTSVICAIVCRDTEQTSRRSFLETALLAEFGARDGLTGLLNRRAFDEHLLRVWQQALRSGQSLALLMIDIDHFKSYNDTYGHQAGDAAIRNVAQILRGFARRPLDLAARYGGDELSLILFDPSRGDVQDIAEGARCAVAGLERSSADSAHQSPITISMGIALVTPTIDRTLQGAIQLADEALYEAKAGGRNRFVLKGLEDYRRFKTGSFRRMTMRTRMPLS